MTREAFIKVLDGKGYPYEIGGNKIVITSESVYSDALTSLPSGVEFRNRADVDLTSVTSLPSGVEFKNGEDVDLSSLMGDWFNFWSGNTEGINPPRLLDKMVSFGLFNKRR